LREKKLKNGNWLKLWNFGWWNWPWINPLKRQGILRNFKKFQLSQMCKDLKNNGTTWKLVSIPFKWVPMFQHRANDNEDKAICPRTQVNWVC
jgi:hypothetical protein